MSTTTVLAGLGGLLLAGSAAVAARPDSFEKAMRPVLAEYLKIHGALAADKETGVAASAARIEKLAARLKPTPSAKDLASVPQRLKAGAAKVRQANGLDSMREAFKSLSGPMVAWALRAKPAGVQVATCSMAKASWLQRGNQVANPYYGPKMLRCGEMVSASGHQGH